MSTPPGRLARDAAYKPPCDPALLCERGIPKLEASFTKLRVYLEGL
jgi:hypothetical protein